MIILPLYIPSVIPLNYISLIIKISGLHYISFINYILVVQSGSIVTKESLCCKVSPDSFLDGDCSSAIFFVMLVKSVHAVLCLDLRGLQVI